jgi:hypothetical protein
MHRLPGRLGRPQRADSPENSGSARIVARIGQTWPAACITLAAISISQLVLNEIAWSPGDPGTGAPSFFAVVMLGICVRPLAALAA